MDESARNGSGKSWRWARNAELNVARNGGTADFWAAESKNRSNQRGKRSEDRERGVKSRGASEGRGDAGPELVFSRGSIERFDGSFVCGDDGLYAE